MKNSNRSVCCNPCTSKIRPSFGFFSLLASGLVALTSAQAANIYWDGTGAWNLAASWSTDPNAATPNPAAMPNIADDIFFSISTVTTAQSIGLTVNNSGARSFTFRGTNPSATSIVGTANRAYVIGAGGITVENGAGPVTIGSATTNQNVSILFGASQTWTQNSSNSFSLENIVNVGSTTVNNSGGITNPVLTLTGTGSGSTIFNNNWNLGFHTSTSGYVYQNSGSVVANNQLAVGSNASYGFYSLAGGSLSVNGGAFRIGTGGNVVGTGVMYVSAGSLNVGSAVTSGLSIVGSSSTDAGLQGNGVLYVTGGTVSSASGINVGGRSGNAQMTISGSALVTTSTSVAIAGAATSTGNSTGILNLNGGTLEATQIHEGVPVQAGTKTSIVNFNGGTLRAAANSSTFMQGLDAVYIRQGGATIDSNSHNITIAQNLLAPTSTGISSITISGTGYSGAPFVTITGDGTGATAVANIDGSGNITGITVTNAGVGYTTATISLVGGGGATNSSAVVNFAANTSGGLTKTGSGILTLTGSNTYTGATEVNAGTLIVGVSGTGSLASAVTVASGATLGGSGVISGPVTVNGTLAPGNSPGSLTINNSLTLADGAFVAMELAGTGAGQYDHINVTGTLTLDGVIKVSLIDGFDPAGGNSFVLFSGWSGSIVDNGFTFDFTDAVLSGDMTWDTADFLTTGAITVVPEPSTWALLSLGVMALGWRFRRKR